MLVQTVANCRVKPDNTAEDRRGGFRPSIRNALLVDHRAPCVSAMVCFLNSMSESKYASGLPISKRRPFTT